jgi:hypothetical protein
MRTLSTVEREKKIAKPKSSVRTWQQRRAEAEKAVAERFGEEVLEKWLRH